MMKVTKNDIGKLVYGVPFGNYERYSKDIKEFTIKSVKTKYMDLATARGMIETLEKDSGFSKSDCNAGYKIYETMQDIEDLKEIKEISERISQAFSYGMNRKELSLNQLKRLEEIINESNRN